MASIPFSCCGLSFARPILSPHELARAEGDTVRPRASSRRVSKMMPSFLPHVRWRASTEKVLAWWHKHVHNLAVLSAPSLVLDASWNYSNISGIEHAALATDAEFHSALEHPHDLLVRMRMRSSM